MTRWNMVDSVTTNLIKFPLNGADDRLLGVPRLGIRGVALATVISFPSASRSCSRWCT
jgi:Na+-driven multidrug efflux pump